MAFDPAAATAAYIDSLGPQALAKARDYTVGAHWLLLWGLLVSLVVTWLIVRSGLLDRIARRFSGANSRAFLIGAATLALSALLTLPWTIYADWLRETRYGRTSQPLGDWLGQQGLMALISIVLGALFFMGVYALIRRAPRLWWLWATGFTAVVMVIAMVVAPVFIEPMFNKYEPVPPGPVRAALEVQAAKAGVPADRIFMYDGSRQSNNFTANAGGVFGTARIAISDVAMKGASLDEVKAVTGHEIGHYVLGHSWRMIGLGTALALLFFLLADWLFPRAARMFGSSARTIADPVGLPVVLFLGSLLGLLLQPLLSTFSRHAEAEADRYSLETVNLPDALSSALVKTAEYRYPRPGPVEEFFFYDHPSVERRVRNAMEWKAKHPAEPLPEQAG